MQESDVEVLATSKVFARGRELFDDGALEELTRQPISNGEKLNALCQGSDDEPYALSIQAAEPSVPQWTETLELAPEAARDGLQGNSGSF